MAGGRFASSNALLMLFSIPIAGVLSNAMPDKPSCSNHGAQYEQLENFPFWSLSKSGEPPPRFTRRISKSEKRVKQAVKRKPLTSLCPDAMAFAQRSQGTLAFALTHYGRSFMLAKSVSGAN